MEIICGWCPRVARGSNKYPETCALASHPGGLPRSAHSPRASSFTGKLNSERKAQICKSEKKKKKWELLGRFCEVARAGWHSYLVSARVDYFWCWQNTDMLTLLVKCSVWLFLFFFCTFQFVFLFFEKHKPGFEDRVCVELTTFGCLRKSK